MKYEKVLPHIFFAILVGVFVFLNNPQIKNVEEYVEKETAKVIRVIDGDTIEISLSGKKKTVRLIGVDAPETADPRKTVECFGKQSSDKAKKMLDGETITLESDPTQGNRDKYERLLRYVFLNDSNFNKLMISEGYAHEYTYQSNPYKYMDEFKNAERDARQNKKGLWADVVQCNDE